ncbi:uncharacterized protein TA11170 [Theileria annulata]|uniref:RNA-editing substrate-binding complex 6 protein domain-containing protein n=1 Tax=Theileria annulata TaxID=5874 RepID=Q4U8I4_THEAN|nr:uncharacterized protein TA11170 [Theileria annulata]CAI76869.1 hypothetical protein TA11170 [Theileria annulata]|eukprot:XP_953494.1 hypothetical protein TA11170 [Theileria annulata]
MCSHLSKIIESLFYSSKLNSKITFCWKNSLYSNYINLEQIRFYSKSTDNNTQIVSDTELDDFCSLLNQDKQNWWSLYVRGEVPDYEPRRNMFHKLTSEGIDVESMEPYEIEDFTRWLLMRQNHGEKYPKIEEENPVKNKKMIRKIYTSFYKFNLKGLKSTRKFATESNVVKHEEFLKNFDTGLQKEDSGEGSNVVIESYNDNYKGSKERFHSFPLAENDMYSNKPVWMQLNEIENAYKLKFKYKSRVEAQKKISKANKSIETLGELESNPSRLVEIDSFRTINSEVKEETKTTEVSKSLETPFSTISDGTHLINDIDLGGDAYYEKVDLNNNPGSIRAPDSIKPQNILKEEKSLLTEIFGDGDDNYIDATKPSAIIESTTNLEAETWLNMDPNHILIQQDLLKSKNTTQVLSSIGDKLKQMNAVNVSTAIHRLAKYTNPYNRYMVVNHESFGKLIALVEDHILKFDPQGLTNIFWSMIKLKITPKWLDCLLEQININANSLNLSELSNCLFCLSKLTKANDSSLELRFKILSLVQDKIKQFKRPLDLTCVSTALARLNVRNPVIFGHISSQVISSLEEFKIQEICGIAWSYASLGFTDHLLFRKIREFIESKADPNNIGNIVHLAWALSKIKEADPDFFLYTVSPLVRSHLSSLNCRQMTTISWAYVNAGVEDQDLFNDIASTLIHHVDEMTTHDVASSVVAFSHIEVDKLLLKKIKSRAALMLNEFTPLQLSKIVAGFAGLADQHFYNQVAKVVDSKLHLMSPENIVEILLGFTNANVLPIQLFTKLLNTVSKSCKKMYAEDSLLLLDLLRTLQGSNISHQLSKSFSNLAQNLIEQIDQRVSRWKCFDVTQITTLFNCLKLGDGTVDVMGTIVKQLASCLNRVYKSVLPLERKREIFLNFLLSTNNLPTNSLNVLKTNFAKDPELIKSFNNMMTLAKVNPDDLTYIEVAVKMLHSCTVIGFSDHLTNSLFDEVMEFELESPIEDVELGSKLIWSLVESNLHVKWALEKIKYFSTNYVFEPNLKDLDSLVRLMWSCAAVSEDSLLLDLTRHLSIYENLFPSEVFLSQQTALHILKCMNNPNVIFSDVELLESGQPQLDKDNQDLGNSFGELEKKSMDILKEWLEYKREDLYVKSKKNKKLRTPEMDHDSFISECLIRVILAKYNIVQMKIPHKTLHVVENIYRVSISFPVENQLLDVVGFMDVLVPRGQIRSSTLLRQRQLQILGYGIHPLRLSSLYESNGEKAKNLIAETISSFNTLAKDHISFTKMAPSA